MPWFTIAIVKIGFRMIMNVVSPVVYWLNIYDAKIFLVRKIYNISKVIGYDFGLLDWQVLVLWFLPCGITFTTLVATITHAILFHGNQELIVYFLYLLILIFSNSHKMIIIFVMVETYGIVQDCKCLDLTLLEIFLIDIGLISYFMNNSEDWSKLFIWSKQEFG